MSEVYHKASVDELEAALAVHRAAVTAACDWFVRNVVMDMEKKIADGSSGVFGLLMTAWQDPTAERVVEQLKDAARRECAKLVCSGCAAGLPFKVAHWAPNARNHIDPGALYGPDQFACKAPWNPAHRSRIAEAVAP